MASRRVHYESAFEDYLRSQGLPYVVVDDAKKAIFGRIALKSFDVVVYSSTGCNLLVDVKGRKFPDAISGAKRKAGRAWENWITRDDLVSLRQWQGVFGEGFRAVLLFAYWLQGPPQRSPFQEVHLYDGDYYAFMAIELEAYATLAKPRSAKWQTLTVPSEPFSRAVRDILELL